MEDVIFDYWLLGRELSVPDETIQEFEEEARNEFPFDGMLAEIHIMRAVKAYAKANTGMVALHDTRPLRERKPR